MVFVVLSAKSSIKADNTIYSNLPGSSTALEGKTQAAIKVTELGVSLRCKEKEPINTGGGGWGLILLGEQSQ